MEDPSVFPTAVVVEEEEEVERNVMLLDQKWLIINVNVIGKEMTIRIDRSQAAVEIIHVAQAEYRRRYPQAQVPHFDSIYNCTQRRLISNNSILRKCVAEADQVELSTMNMSQSSLSQEDHKQNKRSPEQQDFTIVFHKSPFGFTIRQDKQKNYIVANIYSYSVASCYRRLAPGVVLLEINGEPMRNLGIRNVHQKLTSAPLPVEVKFSVLENQENDSDNELSDKMSCSKINEAAVLSPTGQIPRSTSIQRTPKYPFSSSQNTVDKKSKRTECIIKPSKISQRIPQSNQENSKGIKSSAFIGKISKIPVFSKKKAAMPEMQSAENKIPSEVNCQSTPDKPIAHRYRDSPQSSMCSPFSGETSENMKKATLARRSKIPKRISASKIPEIRVNKDASLSVDSVTVEDQLLKRIDQLKSQLMGKHEESKLIAQRIELFYSRLSNVRKADSNEESESDKSNIRLTADLLKEIELKYENELSSYDYQYPMNLLINTVPEHEVASDCSSTSSLSIYSIKSAWGASHPRSYQRRLKKQLVPMSPSNYSTGTPPSRIPQIRKRTTGTMSVTSDTSDSSFHSTCSIDRKSFKKSASPYDRKRRSSRRVSHTSGRDSYIPRSRLLSPAVGSYKVPSSSLNRKGFGFSKDKTPRASFIKESRTPGVGSYDVNRKDHVKGGEIGDSDRDLNWEKL